jgi:uncharacterized Zn-binding protein involved in type VI secretion
MPPAARVGDPTAHPGAISGPGVANVLIGGMPAAVAGAGHVCAAPTPHPPTFFAKGSATVLIGGYPALRANDVCSCGAPILVGLPTVLIGG